ncbi:MAG: Gldg family protein [Burkholderiales bacterium]|nr:Gldg family protein [Burkholderiales bacterium]
MNSIGTWSNFIWFGVWLLALLFLFAMGVRLPLQSSLSGWRARGYSIGIIVVALALMFVATAALITHDTHIDLTRERVFTPSERALQVADHLDRDVHLTWFYQAEDQNGGRVKEIVELMGRRNQHLKVRTVDPDKQPSLAHTYGIRLYNAAIVEAEGRRLLVQSTDENEIAVAILKVLRKQALSACFVEGHKEFSIVNPERQEHYETGLGSHDTDEESMVTITIPRGVLLLSRALESQGYAVQRLLPAALPSIPKECSLVVIPNPRTAHLPAEVDQLEAYLAQGGSLMLLFDVGFTPDARLAALLAKLGVQLSGNIVLDPASHYATDVESVAVPTYEPHAITQKLSLTFFPGVLALNLQPPPEGIEVMPLFSSSPQSYVLAAEPQEPAAARVARVKHETRSHVLAAASEGVWPGSAQPFRAVVVGDADFASNRFFPAVANSDLTLSMVRWLMREEQTPAAKSRIPVAPSILLTKEQMRSIFLLVGVLLPLSAAMLGMWAWWRRR